MTVINLATLATVLGGTTPIDATIDAVPWAGRGPASRTTGDTVVVPDAISLTLTDGVPDEEFNLEPTDGTFCWRIILNVPRAAGFRVKRYVTVPASGPVDWEDLVDVDPATFTPSLAAVAAWEAAIAEVQAIADEMAASLDAGVAALVPDTETATGAALLATFGRGRSVVEFGAVGGNAALDTAAFQSALDAMTGVVYVPEPPTGLPYEIDTSLTFTNDESAKSIIGIGNGMVLINYSGTGHMFELVSPSPADATQAITDIYFVGLKIDGTLNTVSDGAVLVDGGYSVNFDRFEARRFSKSGAVAIDLLNCFSVDFGRSNSLSHANGTGLRIGGSLQQVTNVHIHDFLLQRSAVNLDVDTGITGGGFQLDNGAVRANGSAIAVRVTGKFADMRFGPALHIESETEVSTNTTTGFKFSGASLYASNIKFESIDFYNIKTLFDLDGSSGTLRDVEINHVYATGLTGLAGTAFKLNGITVGFRIGRYQLNTTQYPTVFNLTNTEIAEPIFIPAVEFASVLGTPAMSGLNRWPVWLLDAATSEIVGATVRLPRDWNNFAIDALYVNGGAGAGNVVLRADVATRGAGETLATPSASSPVTSAAGAVNVVVSSTLLSTSPNTAGEILLIDLVRVGGDAADTLTNDVGLLGVLIRRIG